MTELPIFFSFRRCPYAMRARLALLASGQRVAIREVRLRDKPAALLAASAKGTVPVLVLPMGGGVIDQSLDIMRWALGRKDPAGWLDGDDGALIAANDGPFKHGLDRYKYPDRHGCDPLRHRDLAAERLGVLEDRLSHQRFLCGDRAMLADMAILPFVRQFAAVDRSWFDDRVPRVATWLDMFLGHGMFADIMVRLEPWREGDRPVVFPS